MSKSVDTRIDDMIKTFTSEVMNAAEIAYSDDSELVGDLGFDSLDLVSFLAQIEQSWNFVIPDEDFSIERFSTVGSVRKYIKNKI